MSEAVFLGSQGQRRSKGSQILILIIINKIYSSKSQRTMDEKKKEQHQSSGGFQSLFRKGGGAKQTATQNISAGMPQSLQQSSNLKGLGIEGGMLSAIGQNQSYSQAISIEQYREEIQVAGSIEEKLQLLRCQFPQDAFQFDLGHNSQSLQLSPAHQSAMSPLTINLNWTQMEMIQLTLQSVAQIHLASQDDSLNLKGSYLGAKPAVAQPVAHFLPQLQAILYLAFTKALSQNTLNEVLSGQAQPYNILVYKSLLNIIAQWGYFLIAGHGQRLKQGFLNYVRNRVAEILQNIQSGVKDMGKGARQPEKASLEDAFGDNNPTFAQSLPSSGLKGSQKKVQEESKSMNVSSETSLMETLITCSLTLTCSFFHHQTQSGIPAGQESNMSLVLLPILRLCVLHPVLTLSPLSQDSQDSLQLALKLVNTGGFLAAIIDSQPLQTQSLALLTLKICRKMSHETKKRETARAGTPAAALVKSEKFIQCLQQLATRNLQMFITDYVVSKKPPISEVSANNPQQQDEEQMKFPPVFIMTEGTQRELQNMQTNGPAQTRPNMFERREAQKNWVGVSLLLLNLGVESIKSAQQSGALFQALVRTTQDTFKQILYFLGHFQLLPLEHFTNDKIKSLSELPGALDPVCPAIQSFQEIMCLQTSESKQGPETLTQTFEDLGSLMLKGLFSKIDTSCYIRSLYVTFLSKYVSTVSDTVRSGPLVENLVGSGADRITQGMTPIIMKFFTFHFYPESRIKDVEPMDSIKNREAYSSLIGKFKQIELKLVMSQQQKQQIGKEGWAVQEVNRILVQQTAFEVVVQAASTSPKLTETILNQINHVLAAETQETSYTLLYQHLKLAVALMWKDFPRSNKVLYDLLLGPFVQPKAGEESPNSYKYWTASKVIQSLEPFKAFWNIVAIKAKQHLLAKAHYLKMLDSQHKSSSQKQQEVIEAVMKSSAPQSPEGLLREQSFSMIRKILLFGLTNMDVAVMLEAKMKEILKETKDFEHSFELKIGICSMLVIMKDRTPKQLDALMRFESLLKAVYEYITIIDVKYGGEKPSQSSGSARRVFDGDAQTWEQEREIKVKQIKSIVGQAVQLISNYIDYKESPQCLIPFQKEMETTGTMPTVTLEIVLRRNQDYQIDDIINQLKKVITRSNMYGGFLVEQLIRIFFFQRTEVQNLALIPKSSQPADLLFDQMGTPILDSILTFLLEAADTMFQNSPPIIKAFVSYLHSRVITSTNSHLRLARFAKSLTPANVKMLKKVMICIREKEDSGLLESVHLMKEVMVKALSIISRAPIFKEFFSFFKEIFYYNQDMDQVDFDLTCDTLQVMNNVLKTSSSKQQKECLALRNIAFEGVSDYFMFSDITPGVILSESFKVPQENFSISLLFRMNLAQIKAAQERQAQLGLDGSTLTMTFFQLIDRTLAENYQPFSIVINVVGDRLKMHDFECKLDENWHLLVVFFEFKKTALAKKSHSVKIYIDSLSKSSQVSRDIKHTFHKSHEHIFAYGCDAIDIMANAKPGPAAAQNQTTSQMISGNAANISLNQEFRSQQYFQGSVSLPFMYTRLDADKQSEFPIIAEFLVKSLANKSTVGITTTEYVSAMKNLTRSLLKDSLFGSFESHDFNEEVILLHQRAYQTLDHMSTVHTVKPHEILEVLGGYKTLYPVFEKSLLSNLPQHQKAEVWKLLFKVLRTYLNTDPAHILRLYRNKYLLETLKSCIVRAGLAQIITKELLVEIISIVRDVHQNRHAEILEDFYRDFLLKVVLDETICDLPQWDTRSGRISKVFEEVVDNLVSLYHAEESIQEKRIASARNRRMDDGQPSRELFSLPQVANDIYKRLIALITYYSSQSGSYLKYTKKLTYVLMKIILNNSQRQNLQQLIVSIQDFSKSGSTNRTTLLAQLKILEGVISDPEFLQKKDLIETLKTNYNRNQMMKHLNQSTAYQAPDYSSQDDLGAVEDDIIAITLRIVVETQYKLNSQSMPVLPSRVGAGINPQYSTQTLYEEQKPQFIQDLLANLSQNPRGIRLQKTMCSIILIVIQRSQRLINVKYNPAYLKECLKDKSRLNMLEVMASRDFDRDIFALAIRLFKWYSLETKLVFLDFYRQLIEESCNGHIIEDFKSFQNKKFLEYLREIHLGKQEQYILSIVQQAVLQNNEPQIRNLAERVVSSTIKSYFNTSLQMDIDGVLYDEELAMLRIIKKLLVMLEPVEDSLLSVINDVLRYVQEVVNWVWSYVLHDTNRTNLNLKLMLFLQIIEEIVMKKLANTASNRNGEVILLRCEGFYEMMARLLIIFDDIRMMYFDYPSPTVVDTNKRNTIVTGMIRQKETLVARDITFLMGGPLRIFTSLLLQVLRKMKPCSDLVQQTQTISSEDEDGGFQLGEEGGNLKEGRETTQKHHNGSFEHYQHFDCAVELFRFFIFKEETNFITQFRPVPTIEPPASVADTQKQAPLFRIIYNTNQPKRTLFVMQPADLTKQFIENFNEIQDQRETVSTTPGFLPLVLINEMYEIIRRKYTFLKPQHREEYFQVDQFDQRHHLMTMLALLYDIMRHAYMSDEFKENVGFRMIAITDPRIKEELYDSLHPVKLLRRQRKADHRAFFISKAAEYYLQHKVGANLLDSVIQSPQSPEEVAGGMRNTEFDGSANGLRANLQDHYFLRQSDKIAQGLVDVTQSHPQNPLMSSEDHKGEDEQQLFAQAALEGIQKIEARERELVAKDHSQYQDELIAFLTKWYTQLHEYFDGIKQQAKSPAVTQENMKQSVTPVTDFASEPQIIALYKENYIEEPRVTQIMSAIRQVSSEKFKHIYSLNLATREEDEIKRILSRFQVINSSGVEERKLPQNLKSKNATNEDALTSSANSHRELRPMQAPASKGSSNEILPLQYLPPSSRKRSADENDGMFQFEGNNPPSHDKNSSLGKMSLSSANQRPSDLMNQSSTFSGKKRLQPPSFASSQKCRTLDYYYSKQCYKKSVKRLMEDPSSIWYDNLEQIKKDYADMKEIYELVCTLTQSETQGASPQLAPKTIEGESTVGTLQTVQIEPQEEEKKQAMPSLKKEAQRPQGPSGAPISFKSRQYDHFVRQRRTCDQWGRMMLLKPDRNYKQRKFLISHKYFVHDTMKNLFAVALLEDQDFSDYKTLAAQLEDQERQRNGEDSENPQQALNSQTIQSEHFKKLRELLMSKIEQNDFLYTLLTSPDKFMNDDNKPFEYHPLNRQIDPSIQHISEVQYITVEGGQMGDLYLSGQYLMFKSKPETVKRDVKFAMKREEIVRKTNKVWPIGNLEQVFKRRYLLVQQGIELYTRDKKSYFLNLLTVDACQTFLTHLKPIVLRHNKQNPSKRVDLIEDAKNEFKARKFIDLWNKGQICTQQFLLLLNKFSGRSFNDFGQYPIFPWILSDYSCTYEELKQKTDKNEIDGFRDLLLNSGVISEKKQEMAKTQFEASIEGDEMIYGAEKYHLKFGFSNRIFSLGYLIRMEPFTDNFIQVNGGLDNPDRIFYSFQDQWTSLLNDKQNNSELTPEFFYMPEIFRNHNLASLGRSRSNLPVNEVTLPRWAQNEHDFVRIHREMLESKHVAYTIRFWIDMLFGVRQKDADCMNRYYCYAYEDWVNANMDQVQDHNVETISEFLQVPMKILAKPLFQLDKKGMGISLQVPQQYGMQPIDEENEYEDVEDMNTSQMSKQQPQNQMALAKQKMQNAYSGNVQMMQNKKQNKLAGNAAIRQAQLNMIQNSRTARDPSGVADPLRMAAANAAGDFSNSSLIQKFLDGILQQNQKRTENDLKKIQESHKIDKPDEVNIFHMAFSQLNGRCFVFLADKFTGQVNCVACRESFLQQVLENPRPLGGLKKQNLRGDYHNIFQLYGGGIGDKNALYQKQPLLFTCQNLDNSIKVYDLSIKKGSQIVYQERKHNNVVTSIKFSNDFKYFFSGDADGVLCHYTRNVEDVEEQTSQQSVLIPGPNQDKGLGKMMQQNRLVAHENSGAKCFPFTLKHKFQDHSSAVLAIDINATLDMYVTASRDGTLALRCLRSSTLWKVIQLEKLQQPSMEVQSLKLSLHGYIVVMMKNTQRFFTFVYSINGDQLVSTQRENDQFEFKYAQLTQNEDNMIMVFNQKLKKEEKEMQGTIRVSRLYDLEKDPKRDNLQKTFYSMINEQLTGQMSSRQKSQMQQSHRSAMMSENSAGFAKVSMPSVVSFALSQDESKMNLYLKSGEIVCFDESRSQIIEQLDDFGLA